jgi:hypothetical protein
MADPLLIDHAQLQTIISTIASLRDGSPYWQRFLVSAAPVFFGAVLGLAFGFFTDWRKTRRENLKLSRERQEGELAKLSGVMTALGFNIEALIHTAMQQILPHHKQSHAAVGAALAVRSNIMQIQEFDELLHSEFRPMMARCPDPYFIEVELFKEIPFIVAKDPSLLKQSGWILTFERNLRNILSERNKLIDLATLGKDAVNFEMIERQAATQASISEREIVDCYQLLEQLRDVSKKLETIIRQNYKDVFGPKLKVMPPEAFQAILGELERLCKEIVPDWPPPEPSVSDAS